MKLLALTTWDETSRRQALHPVKNGASAALIGKKRKFIEGPAHQHLESGLALPQRS